jgi:Ca-activated chloride channel homolog
VNVKQIQNFMKNLISLLFVLAVATILMSADQPRVITGKVTDSAGSPIAGVSVLVKNTNRGAVTDYNGEYSLTVKPEDKILVFSFIGFKSLEVKITQKNRLDVSLEAEKLKLEEVVVVGYGAKRERYYLNSPQASMVADYDATFYQHPDFNTEGYSTVHENGYKLVMNDPLSTFSIDVDRASYSNVRRFINMGQMPPVDAVRIEEMINYFSYDYPEPEGKHPFSVYTELSTCPWNSNHQLLHIGLKGREMEKSSLPASNLVFLIDVSGSMESPNKLPLLKNAFNLLVNQLRPNDRVAIVVYAGAAGLVLESTPGSQKETILKAIDRLSAGGSTAGGQGLKLAYKVAEENFIKGGNNRIIIASDGDFNVGPSSNAEMERMIETEREKGIFITVLGFGMGNYKDDKMEIIANKGNGNYSYIDNIQEARKVLVSEFAGTLFTIAKDVKFQLEFNPARVQAYRLIGYENRLLNKEDFNNDKKDAGEMGAGHTVTALYEIIPAGSDVNIAGVDPLKYQANASKVKPDPNAELLTIKLRYKQPDGETSILIDKPERGRLIPLNQTSDNFRFSAAVAQFGLLLRGSEFKGNANIDQVVSMARNSRGNDDEGFRSEFIQLVRTASSLKELNAER